MEKVIDKPNLLKGGITCYEAFESYETLLKIRPESYFGQKPIKWETGWDSADTGDMSPSQNFSWAEFIFENLSPERIFQLEKDFPDNEWAFEIED